MAVTAYDFSTRTTSRCEKRSQWLMGPRQCRRLTSSNIFRGKSTQTFGTLTASLVSIRKPDELSAGLIWRDYSRLEKFMTKRRFLTALLMTKRIAGFL